MRSLPILASCAGLASAHGHSEEYLPGATIDTAFEGKVDVKPDSKDIINRTYYGFSKCGLPIHNTCTRRNYWPNYNGSGDYCANPGWC
ncbi:hypothetical protein Vi05172_g12116 [Venturia inaequalis]|nr:hypothetical protein Vi05172_g12116 [Venturia inaequalis]